MIIDGHVHIADEPDVGGFGAATLDGPGLLRLMDGPYLVWEEQRRVDYAVVQPMITPTRQGDPRAHHAYVLEQVRAHPTRLAGCFVANPLLDTERSVAVLRELADTGYFKAMKLHPTGHGYLPFKQLDRLEPLVDAARDLRFPVIVHQGDPPFGHPSQLAPLIESFPSVVFVLAHFGTQRVVMADEAIYVARKNDNVHLETGWGALPRLKEGLAALGAERLVFASDCPVQEIGSQLRTVEVLTWNEPIGVDLPRSDAERMLGGNMAGLLGLKSSHELSTTGERS